MTLFKLKQVGVLKNNLTLKMVSPKEVKVAAKVWSRLKNFIKRDEVRQARIP